MLTSLDVFRNAGLFEKLKLGPAHSCYGFVMPVVTLLSLTHPFLPRLTKPDVEPPARDHKERLNNSLSKSVVPIKCLGDRLKRICILLDNLWSYLVIEGLNNTLYYFCYVFCFTEYL